MEYKWGKIKIEPRLEAMRNRGIIFHKKGEKEYVLFVLECQIQQGDTGDLWVIKDHQIIGIKKDGFKKVIDSRIKPHFMESDRSDQYELEIWNKILVEVRGAKGVKFYENGHAANTIKKFLDFDGNPSNNGNIVLQAERSEITYSNIRLQETRKNN